MIFNIYNYNKIIKKISYRKKNFNIIFIRKLLAFLIKFFNYFFILL